MALSEYNIQTTTENIDWSSLEQLFFAAGLNGRQAGKLKKAYQNSQIVLFVFDGNRLIGTARALTDWEYHAGV